MIIDFHTHVMLPEMITDPFWRGRCPMTIEAVVEAAKEGGVDRTVISNAALESRTMDPDQQLKFIRRIDEYHASLAMKYDNIYFLASSLPWGGEPYLKELERSVREDGAKGVIIQSSLPGHYPDDDDALAFFQLVTELDIPVFMHPTAFGFGEERLKIYRLASSVGRPTDSALAIARLIVRGIFERFPTLKFVASHLGGGICEMIGRMNYAYELMDECFFLGSYEPMMIKHPPLHYLKMMYLESTCYHVPAARCAVETVGVDHFVFGTDAPPLKSLKKPGVEVIRSLNLPPEDEQKVFCDNARKLLKI